MTAPDMDDNGALSILGQLQARREEIVKTNHLDLPVPRWTRPEIIVRYGHVDHAVIKRGMNMLERAPKREQATAEVNANIDVLIAGCKAVIARIDGQDYSLREGDPKGEPTTFDMDLASNLGLPEHATARDVVRALFISEGDIFSHAQAVSEFSGYRESVADEEVLGE